MSYCHIPTLQEQWDFIRKLLSLSLDAQVSSSETINTLMSETICKFQITSKEKFETHVYNKNHPVPVVNLTAMPVYGNSKENESFFAATPGGQLQLGVVNRDAVKDFEIGDEVYIIIKKAPKPDLEKKD